MTGPDVAPMAWALLGGALAGTVALRMTGVVAGSLLREGTALYRWIGCVAFAISAGLMAKLLFVPTGVLAETPLLPRILGVAVGLGVLWLGGRHLGVAILAAVAAFAGLTHVL